MAINVESLATRAWMRCGLHLDPLLQSLKSVGITQPTKIQALALPPAFRGKDVVIRAPTGTGKSLGFSLVLAQNLALPTRNTTKRSKLEAIVITPTGNLAQQLQRWLNFLIPPALVERHAIQVVVNEHDRIAAQDELLDKHRPIVLIGTAARIRTLASTRPNLLENLRIVAVDEVDEVFKFLGRYSPLSQWTVRQQNPRQSELLLNELISSYGKTFQTIFASATVNTIVRSNAVKSGWLVDPVFAELGAPQDLPSSLLHTFIEAPTDHARFRMAHSTIESLKPQSVLIYIAPGVDATTSDVKRALKYLSLPVRLLKDATSPTTFGQFPGPGCWVADPLETRGIDTVGVDLVVIFGAFAKRKDYLHAAGRAARVSMATATANPGKCITFYTPAERSRIKAIGYELRVDVDVPDSVQQDYEEYLHMNRQKKANEPAATTSKATRKPVHHHQKVKQEQEEGEEGEGEEEEEETVVTDYADQFNDHPRLRHASFNRR